jgi:hypothetical protein
MKYPICMALLFALVGASHVSALEVGQELPWLTASEVIQFGQPFPAPLHLERFRGAPMILFIWEDKAAGSQKQNELLGRAFLDYRKQGVLVFGVVADQGFTAKGAASTGIGGPMLVVGAEGLKALGPIGIYRVRYLIVDGNGTVIGDALNAIPPPTVAKAKETATLHGRWVALARPFFERESPVAAAQALRVMVNAGAVGKAMDKARDNLDKKDEALVGESQHLLDECQLWLDAALALEEEARATGDRYLAWTIADDLAATLKGIDEGKAAADRAKLDAKDAGYAAGEDFYSTWEKTWVQPDATRRKTWEGWLKKNPEGLYAERVRGWLGEAEGN